MPLRFTMLSSSSVLRASHLRAYRASPGATYIDPKFFNGDGSLKSPNHVSADEGSVYDAQLTVAMSERVQMNSMLEKFRDTLGRVNGIDN